MNPNRKILRLIVVLALAGFATAVYDFLTRSQGIQPAPVRIKRARSSS